MYCISNLPIIWIKHSCGIVGYVNKKRIAQLQKDGKLESFDLKDDDVCESCLLGNITKSPFTGSCERGEGFIVSHTMTELAIYVGKTTLRGS